MILKKAEAAFSADRAIPNRAGVGLKAEHYEEILRNRPNVGWFEIHAENYMGDGGPPHHFLSRIRENYPISCHGVGLSIGGEQDLDDTHLDRLALLIDRYQPGLFSEHLAWSTHDTYFFNDLLPLPYNKETAKRVSQHIDIVQERLQTQMLLENPSTYVAFAESDMSEVDFLREIVAATGCGLLLDVNNVYVSANNQKYDPYQYIADFPLPEVQEIHLGGHAPDIDEHGDTLLIDAHDREVIDPVWRLFEDVVARCGPLPTLIEWDSEVPGWERLFAEAKRADERLIATTGDSSPALATDATI